MGIHDCEKVKRKKREVKEEETEKGLLR